MWSVWHVQTQITLHGLAGWFTRRLWMETRSFTFHFADFQTEFSGVDHGGFVSLPLVLQSILINRSLSGWRIDAAASTCSQELRRNVTRLASLLLFAALCICWSLSDEAVIVIREWRVTSAWHHMTWRTCRETRTEMCSSTDLITGEKRRGTKQCRRASEGNQQPSVWWWRKVNILHYEAYQGKHV